MIHPAYAYYALADDQTHTISKFKSYHAYLINSHRNDSFDNQCYSRISTTLYPSSIAWAIQSSPLSSDMTPPSACGRVPGSAVRQAQSNTNQVIQDNHRQEAKDKIYAPTLYAVKERRTQSSQVNDDGTRTHRLFVVYHEVAE